MSTVPVTAHGTVDGGLRQRAGKVVPGGMYGHLSVANLPADYPQFFARGQGARIWDVDGNEFVDLMCSWGPMLLGHAHPAVDAAAKAVIDRGDVLNGPASEMVDLAERLVENVSHADWAMFAKNGNDVTTLAIVVARAATGRRKVLVAAGAYHGIAGWSLAADAVGMTPQDHANTIFFEYNDLDSVEAAVDLAGDDLAAIVVTPIRHDLYRDLEAPEPEFARGLRTICDRAGAALVIDDVRCGLRLDTRGSWESLGVRPDLSAWSKSLANGHPLAALMGNEAMRDAARRVLATGSFWLGAAPMAAALATLDELERTDAIGKMRAAGRRLQDGLVTQGVAHGLQVTVSGPPQLPFMTFTGDATFERAGLWAGACAHNGVYLHPVHNWFVSAAHDDDTIDRALDATDEAFALVRDTFGAD
ncbi:MAG: fumI [Marmoricola sp.]|nr:fumI [Marmoricola sp.]